jgi:hypothetical protein
VDEIVFLCRRFGVQLVLRAISTSLVVVAIVSVFLLLTSPLTSLWFTNVPIIGIAGAYIQQHNPWDFFVYAFIVTTVIGYARQMQDAFVDRLNLRSLIQLSEAELAAADDPMQGLGARRAMLGARRRLLEVILAFVPALTQVVAVGAILALNGLVTAFVACLIVAAGITASVPWMTSRFARRRAEILASSDNPEGIAREKDPRLRAKRALGDTAARMRVLVHRPFERLRVGWPVVSFAVVGAVATAGSILDSMTRAGNLPARSTLLIVFLILSARAILSAAQKAEDVAFFATALQQIGESEDGAEAL